MRNSMLSFEYKTQTDLIYREEAEAKADKYIAERCRLDLTSRG